MRATQMGHVFFKQRSDIILTDILQHPKTSPLFFAIHPSSGNTLNQASFSVQRNVLIVLVELRLLSLDITPARAPPRRDWGRSNTVRSEFGA